MSKYHINNKNNNDKITLNQHIIPRRSIERFYNGDKVHLFLKQHHKIIQCNSNEKIFCCPKSRTWCQPTEEGWMKNIEDMYQYLVSDNILPNYKKQGFTLNDKATTAILNKFTALWMVRHSYKTRTGGSWVKIICDRISEQDTLNVQNGLSVVFQKKENDNFILYFLDENNNVCQEEISNNGHNQEINSIYRKYTKNNIDSISIMDKFECKTLINIAKVYGATKVCTESIPMINLPSMEENKGFSQKERQKLEVAGFYTFNNDASIPDVFVNSTEILHDFKLYTSWLKQFTWKILTSKCDLICSDIPIIFRNTDTLSITLFYPITPKIALAATSESNQNVISYLSLNASNKANEVAFKYCQDYCFARIRDTLSYYVDR